MSSEAVRKNLWYGRLRITVQGELRSFDLFSRTTFKPIRWNEEQMEPTVITWTGA